MTSTHANVVLFDVSYHVRLDEWTNADGNYCRVVSLLGGGGPFAGMHPQIHGLTAQDVARNLEAELAAIERNHWYEDDQRALLRGQVVGL